MSGIFTDEAFNLVKEDLATVTNDRSPRASPRKIEDRPRPSTPEDDMVSFDDGITYEEIRAMSPSVRTRWSAGLDLQDEIMKYSIRQSQEELDEWRYKPGRYPFDLESSEARRTEYLNAWMRWLSSERLSPDDELRVAEIQKASAKVPNILVFVDVMTNSSIADLETYKTNKQISERNWAELVEMGNPVDTAKFIRRRFGVAATPVVTKLMSIQLWREGDADRNLKRKAFAIEDEPEDYLFERQKAHDIEKILSILSCDEKQKPVGLEGSIWAPCQSESK